LVENEEGEKVNLIKNIFEIEFETVLKNLEIPEEPVTIKQETNKKLMCTIDNNIKAVNSI